jgi:hypothetical protein
MRKLLCTLAAVLAVPAFAGSPVVSSGKSMSTPVVDQSCFDAGWTLSGFAAFVTPDADIDETWGGGVQVDYFFSPYIGLAASGTWSDVADLYYLDLTLRAPIGIAAPYALGGVGMIVGENDEEVMGRAGVGLDVRVWNCHGIFADWTYNFSGGGGGDDDLEDFQVVRFGLRFAL